MNRKVLALAVILLSACTIQQPITEPIPDRTSEPSTSSPRPTSPTVSASTTPAEPLTEEDIEYFDVHPMMVPVDGVEPRVLRDTFHEGRDSGRTHNATDILAPRGTPVLAAIAGEV